jgi:hypothetical protein
VPIGRNTLGLERIAHRLVLVVAIGRGERHQLEVRETPILGIEFQEGFDESALFVGDCA